MCELLGIAAAGPVAPGPHLGAFFARAAHSVHGWGMGWFDDDGAHVVKEAVRADASELAAGLVRDPPAASTFVVHLRAATVGSTAPANTHPFTGTASGRDWVFAHNGTIAERHDLDLGGRTPTGSTDSELGFLHLLAALDGCPDDDLDVIEGVARDLTRRGRANFVLTDGTTLYARYDGWKTLHLAERAGSAVVATVALSDDRWEPLLPGTLLACRAGRVVARRRDR